MKSPTHARSQQALFEVETDAALMHKLRQLPKIDLHRHLTGSIDAETAARIGAKYEVPLPTYIAADLESRLYGQKRVENLQEYFLPWETLNGLFVSRESTRDIVLEVVRKAAEDNVAYLELRTSPRGFLGHDGFSFEEFLDAVTVSAFEAEATYGTVTRFILGISRHIFGRIQANVLNRMYGQILSMLSSLKPSCFVGVDLNGVETAGRLEDFEVCFKMAHERGFNITIHAGECGPPSNVEYAVTSLHALRIGHGVAAGRDTRLLGLLAERGTVLEVCPTSNQLLGIIPEVKDLPLQVLQAQNVSFVICTDNPARCKTSLSEELFKVAKAFSLSYADIMRLNSGAIDTSFADAETRKMLKLRLGATPNGTHVESTANV